MSVELVIGEIQPLPELFPVLENHKPRRYVHFVLGVAYRKLVMAMVQEGSDSAAVPLLGLAFKELRHIGIDLLGIVTATGSAVAATLYCV